MHREVVVVYYSSIYLSCANMFPRLYQYVHTTYVCNLAFDIE